MMIEAEATKKEALIMKKKAVLVGRALLVGLAPRTLVRMRSPVQIWSSAP